MTSLELLQEIDAWLSFNTEPSREETAKLRKSIKDHLTEQLRIQDVSHRFSKEDLWDAWWASAIKTISFSGVDKDYERRCFEKFYENKLASLNGG